MKSTCPNCGKDFRDYSPPFDTFYCSINCAFDTSTETCKHGYSAYYCIKCAEEFLRPKQLELRPKQLEFDFEETK